ncbi:MAG: hypothetical protein ACHQAX_07585 [Gammaproteobacteria bacterium]
MGTPISTLKSADITEAYKKELLENPQQWIDLLHVCSWRAMQYLDSWATDEIATLLKNSHNQGTFRTSALGKWLAFVCNFYQPKRKYSGDWREILQMLMPKLDKHYILLTENVSHRSPEGPETNAVWGYTYSHPEFKTTPTDKYVACSMLLDTEQGVKSKSLFEKALIHESTTAKAMAALCLKVLKASPDLSLNAELSRIRDGIFRQSIITLIDLQQLELVTEIFKKISPNILIKEINNEWRANKLLEVLISALNFQFRNGTFKPPMLRQCVSDLLDHMASDPASMITFRNKFGSIFAPHLLSLHLKHMETKPALSPCMDGLELTPIRIQPLFFDNMTFYELTQFDVYPGVIEHDLLPRPDTLFMIADKNFTLACAYVNGLNEDQTKAWVSKTSTDKLHPFMIRVLGFNDRTTANKLLAAMNDDDMKQGVLAAFEKHKADNKPKPVLTEVQKLKLENETLKKENEQLKQENTALKTQGQSQLTAPLLFTTPLNPQAASGKTKQRRHSFP